MWGSQMGNENWETPDYFFKRCEEAWGPFGLDAAATIENCKDDTYIGPDQEGYETDGLAADWCLITHHECAVWCNPPYKNLKMWVLKALKEADNGLRVVMLLPNDTDTLWFSLLQEHAEIYLTEGRIKFVDPEGNGRSSPRQGHLVAVLHPPVEGLTRHTGVVGTIKAGA